MAIIFFIFAVDMSNIIQLLPDAVANQIAAGEVVQRPDSVVKELMENSLDAGADKVQLIIQNAGKTLIQIIDNGCGMSSEDAELSFSRHATSKIKKAEDIFSIRTMGFRGEALASIGAVAQVEVKTRRPEDELGNTLLVEGSKVQSIEPAAHSTGTSIAVKNLFYNIPARRNFLKSNPVELRHIIEEFQRIALANSHLSFTMHNDGKEMFHLETSNLKQRIVHLFGKNYNERLVPVEEETSIANIYGFIGKPQYAKKTRGEQYFFVNKRFIRDPYLNHAVMDAYKEILPTDAYPLYILFIEIDPSKIDVNVHPTKTEIKYQDDRALYAILKSAIKRSLGQYNVAPTLDFNQETSFSGFLTDTPKGEIKPPTISFNPNFNPFDQEDQETSSAGGQPICTSAGGSKSSYHRAASSVLENWEDLYKVTEETPSEQLLISSPTEEEEITTKGQKNQVFFQLHNQYILTQIHSGLLVIHQQRAHERILYEQFRLQLANNQGSSQQTLFPQTIELSAADASILEGVLDDIQALGFLIRPFGGNTFVIDGIPAELDQGVDEIKIIEKILEDIKNNKSTIELDRKNELAKSLAKSTAIKPGTHLDQQAMSELVDKLFACELPNTALNGQATIITLSLQDFIEKFKNKPQDS